MICLASTILLARRENSLYTGVDYKDIYNGLRQQKVAVKLTDEQEWRYHLIASDRYLLRYCMSTQEEDRARWSRRLA